jgi:hypothetical protein
MMIRAVVARTRDLVLQPKDVLLAALAESGTPRDVLVPYVLWVAAVGPIAGFLSLGLIGVYHPPTSIFNTVVPGGYTRAFGPALVQMLVAYGLGVGAWRLLALALDLLAPRFGGQHDAGGAYKSAAFALTPVWLGGGMQLLGSVPYLGTAGTMVGLFGGLLYGVLIGVWAVPVHHGTPEAKAPGHVLAAMGFTVVATLAADLALLTLFGATA